jgi:hypothetical protein
LSDPLEPGTNLKLTLETNNLRTNYHFEFIVRVSSTLTYQFSRAWGKSLSALHPSEVMTMSSSSTVGALAPADEDDDEFELLEEEEEELPVLEAKELDEAVVLSDKDRPDELDVEAPSRTITSSSSCPLPSSATQSSSSSDDTRSIVTATSESAWRLHGAPSTLSQTRLVPLADILNDILAAKTSLMNLIFESNSEL